MKVSLWVDLRVSRRLYFGYLPIVKIRGLRDEHTGCIVTNAFTTGMLSPWEVEESWTLINDEADAPARPVMRLLGLDCFEITE